MFFCFEPWSTTLGIFLASRRKIAGPGLWLVRFEPWSTFFLILCDFPAMAHNQKITNILEKK